MSQIAFFGALETGLVFALVAFGVFLSFRVLDFPDLTVDGSFPLGAAVSATMIVSGVDPWLATFCAILAGAGAGIVTAWMNIKLDILHLLASILTMIALYSINLRIMGKPNTALLGDETVLTPLEQTGLPYFMPAPITFAIIVIFVAALLLFFLKSEMGLAMRAAGANKNMAQAQGINTGMMVMLGMAISNGLVALAGALFAQSQGSADVTMGVGVIVVGLASVIGGEAILHPKTLIRAIIACIIGAILYRLAIALALNIDFLGIKAQDLNLITAVIVAVAIVIPRFRSTITKIGGVKR